MKLVAEILTGSLFYVEVGEDATVGDLKKEIGIQENLPMDRLILMLDADERSLLDKDDVSLKDYGVQDGSHMYLFFEPLDEGSPSSPSTPRDSASNEPSNEANEPSPSVDFPKEPSNEANEPSPSVDPSSDQHEE